jgi:hypothetical protein
MEKGRKKKAKKKAKYWADKPIFYNAKFLVAVYAVCTLLAWSILFALPVSCQTVNQTTFFAEEVDSYMVQSCTSIVGNAVRVVYFR